MEGLNLEVRIERIFCSPAVISSCCDAEDGASALLAGRDVEIGRRASGVRLAAAPQSAVVATLRNMVSYVGVRWSSSLVGTMGDKSDASLRV